jgi:hypothetical protein
MIEYAERSVSEKNRDIIKAKFIGLQASFVNFFTVENNPRTIPAITKHVKQISKENNHLRY